MRRVAVVSLLKGVRLIAEETVVRAVFQGQEYTVLDSVTAAERALINSLCVSNKVEIESQDLLAVLASPPDIIARLVELRLVETTISSREHEILRFRIAFGNRLTAGAPVPSGRRLGLSRFALLRRQGEKLIIESPLSPCVFTLLDERCATALLSLHGYAHVGAILQSCADVLDLALVELLMSASIVVDLSEGAELPDWEVHDLLFHARSRTGRHASPSGSKTPQPSDRKPSACLGRNIERVALPTPVVPDSCLTRALGSRKSRRDWACGDAAITFEQLSTFLAISGVFNCEPEHARPFPSAGGLYALETYMVIDECRGVAPGVYMCHPSEPVLLRSGGVSASTMGILSEAQRSMGAARNPSVLIILAAKFPEPMGRYASIAYANILKDVGAMMQQFYLVAANMGLSGCALGSGNIEHFARAIGLDWLEVGSVGEFALGAAIESGDG
jgi:SagB-type dehydrogenase family enzyme